MITSYPVHTGLRNESLPLNYVTLLELVYDVDEYESL